MINPFQCLIRLYIVSWLPYNKFRKKSFSLQAELLTVPETRTSEAGRCKKRKTRKDHVVNELVEVKNSELDLAVDNLKNEEFRSSENNYDLRKDELETSCHSDLNLESEESTAVKEHKWKNIKNNILKRVTGKFGYLNYVEEYVHNITPQLGHAESIVKVETDKLESTGVKLTKRGQDCVNAQDDKRHKQKGTKRKNLEPGKSAAKAKNQSYQTKRPCTSSDRLNTNVADSTKIPLFVNFSLQNDAENSADTSEYICTNGESQQEEGHDRYVSRKVCVIKDKVKNKHDRVMTDHTESEGKLNSRSASHKSHKEKAPKKSVFEDKSCSQSVEYHRRKRKYNNACSKTATKGRDMNVTNYNYGSVDVVEYSSNDVLIVECLTDTEQSLSDETEHVKKDPGKNVEEAKCEVVHGIGDVNLEDINSEDKLGNCDKQYNKKAGTVVSFEQNAEEIEEHSENSDQNKIGISKKHTVEENNQNFIVKDINKKCKISDKSVYHKVKGDSKMQWSSERVENHNSMCNTVIEKGRVFKGFMDKTNLKSNELLRIKSEIESDVCKISRNVSSGKTVTAAKYVGEFCVDHLKTENTQDYIAENLDNLDDLLNWSVEHNDNNVKSFQAKIPNKQPFKKSHVSMLIEKDSGNNSNRNNGCSDVSVHVNNKDSASDSCKNLVGEMKVGTENKPQIRGLSDSRIDISDWAFSNTARTLVSSGPTARDNLAVLSHELSNVMNNSTEFNCTSSHNYVLKHGMDSSRVPDKLVHVDHFGNEANKDETIDANKDETKSEGHNKGDISQSKSRSVKSLKGRGKRKSDVLFTKIVNEDNARKLTLLGIKKGKHGNNPHIIRVTKEGKITDVTNEYQQYLPNSI